ncbi:hypothetical protein JW962_02495 [Candidatus Dojkabacteria bacterium]|nr:hypothetical protein [Candidatus Dojkabacteria bacterium]
MDKTAEAMLAQILGGALNFTKFDTLEDAIKSLLRLGTLAAALVAVVMLIYGGLAYIISTGDSQKTEKAQNTIIYSLVGLVIVGLAWLLVEFILKVLGIEGDLFNEVESDIVASLIRR